MSVVRTLAAVGLLGLAGACATAPPVQTPVEPVAHEDPGPGPGDQTAEADQEAIYSASLGAQGLSARVRSNGCTAKTDFSVQVLDGYPAPTVIIRRSKPDLCRALVPGGVEILFGWRELRLPPTSPIVLANPLTPSAGPVR